MSTHRHLKLQLFRLKPLHDWNVPREGLFFVFPVAGAGEYLSDSSASIAAEPLASGDVLVLQGGSRGKVGAALGTELAFYAFSVCIEHLFPIFMADEIALMRPLLDGLKAGRLHPAANPATVGWHQLIREAAPESDFEHRSQLLHVAAAILSQEINKLRPPLSHYERADGHVTRLFEQLSVDQILNLSVEEMASRFGCSQRHLNRLFKEHFGLPVGVLRMEMRLLKAIPLLRNLDLNILHVAQQCGFNHLGLFNACFKRRFGVSPGKWRRNFDTDEKPGRAQIAGRPSCRMREFGLCPLSETLVGQADGESTPRSADGKTSFADTGGVKARLAAQRVVMPSGSSQ